MKYFTDVIEEQKALRKRVRKVCRTYIYTILLIILFSFIEFNLFP